MKMVHELVRTSEQLFPSLLFSFRKKYGPYVNISREDNGQSNYIIDVTYIIICDVNELYQGVGFLCTLYDQIPPSIIVRNGSKFMG